MDFPQTNQTHKCVLIHLSAEASVFLFYGLQKQLRQKLRLIAGSSVPSLSATEVDMQLRAATVSSSFGAASVYVLVTIVRIVACLCPPVRINGLPCSPLLAPKRVSQTPRTTSVLSSVVRIGAHSQGSCAFLHTCMLQPFWLSILVVAAILVVATVISRHELQPHALVFATKRVLNVLLRRRHRVTSRRTRQPGAALLSAVTGRGRRDCCR